jgi:hypothetical protein
MSQTKNHLFALPLELFEEVTSYLDYFSLKSISCTSRLAHNKLIPKTTVLTALLGLELYDDAEKPFFVPTEPSDAVPMLPCYSCLLALPAESNFHPIHDTDPQGAGFRADFASTRMCKACDEKAGGMLSRAPKFGRMSTIRLAMLKRRGVVLAGREEIYRMRKEGREKKREWEGEERKANMEKRKRDMAARWSGDNMGTAKVTKFFNDVEGRWEVLGQNGWEPEVNGAGDGNA